MLPCIRNNKSRGSRVHVEGREYMPRDESTRVKSRVEGKVESKVEGLKMSLEVGKKQKPVPLGVIIKVGRFESRNMSRV